MAARPPVKASQRPGLDRERTPTHAKHTTTIPSDLVHPDGTAWRLDYLTGRWQLSRYVPATETWQRVGSYPNRKAAISAAYGRDGDQDA
jgi:hypothetical protein